MDEEWIERVEEELFELRIVYDLSSEWPGECGSGCDGPFIWRGAQCVRLFTNNVSFVYAFFPCFVCSPRVLESSRFSPSLKWKIPGS